VELHSYRGRALICAIGLLLRLAFAFLYWVDQPLTHDEREYLALARSIARGDGFTYPADEPAAGTAQQFGRAPGYPLFLAALGVSRPSDTVPARVKVAQAIVGTIGIWLIAAIAARAAGPKAGTVAATIAAVYPPLVFIPAYAFSETLFSTVALFTAWVLDRAVASPTMAALKRPPYMGPRDGWALAAASGALTAAAILIRPMMLFFVPLAIVWLLVSRRGSARVSRTIIFAAAVVICIAPWTIRNARTYGRLILVASEGGVTFWTGNHPLARGEGDLAANPALKREELAFRRSHSGLTPEELEPLYYRDALKWIASAPGSWLKLEVRKLFYTVVPIGPSYQLHSRKYFAASAVSYVLLLVPAGLGAWRLAQRGRAPAPLWLMAASAILASLVFFPQERFRIPVIDPALIVSAAALAGPLKEQYP
jgi:4-amino-4-deoxy-L-arabinose transferase-like glycosyltransferase